MESVSAAASVVAIVEVALKASLLCAEYAQGVKHANDDIQRVQKEVDSVSVLLQEVKKITEDSQGQLRITEAIYTALKGCHDEIAAIEARLETKKTSRPKWRSLKWPFESKEVGKIIDNLQRYQQTINLALQVDQTTLLLALRQKTVVPNLPIADGAAFDSHANEHDARCLPDTRTELLAQITRWVEAEDSKCIYWLCGMAGTGKSTISRTVAQAFAKNNQLVANFFFKKNEGYRATAARFFTTIASQLAVKVPALAQAINRAVDTYPDIADMALGSQFDKLVFKPLQELQTKVDRLVIVIDALDECDRDEDIRALLLLLPKLQELDALPLRIFITSRPELPIRDSFKVMSASVYAQVVLHDLDHASTRHDISVLYNHELAKIRGARYLPESWPGESVVDILVDMAVPLFIYAATVCRYLADPRQSVEKRLASILASKGSKQTRQVSETYVLVLNQLIEDQDDASKEEILHEFREAVGAIIVLSTPLSVLALAELLATSDEDVKSRLCMLHSVIDVPSSDSEPVRILHLSFRDFLVEEQHPCFGISESDSHYILLIRSLELLTGTLREDICQLRHPGTKAHTINKHIINKHISSAVRYACCNWIHHAEACQRGSLDNGPIHEFLLQHLLHWLEVMSILRHASETVTGVLSLLSSVNAKQSPQLYAFASDAKLFILENRASIEDTPLQLYSSALIFAPDDSLVREQFKECVPSWIQYKRLDEYQWSGSWLTIHVPMAVGDIYSLKFSPDEQELLISGYGYIALYNSTTGALISEFECLDALYSPAGNQIAVRQEAAVELRDRHSGAVQFIFDTPDALEEERLSLCSFSPNGMYLALTSSPHEIKIYNTRTGTLDKSLTCPNIVNKVEFSADGKSLATISMSNSIVRTWDVRTASLLLELEYRKLNEEEIPTLIWSWTSSHLAIFGEGYDFVLWDASTGATVLELKCDNDKLYTNFQAVFLKDNQRLVIGRGSEPIQVWDLVHGAFLPAIGNLLDHYLEKNSSLFTLREDGQKLYYLGDKALIIWDTETGTIDRFTSGRWRGAPLTTISKNANYLATFYRGNIIYILDMKTRSTSAPSEPIVLSIKFSPSRGWLLCSCSGGIIELWETASMQIRHKLEMCDTSRTPLFSRDESLLAVFRNKQHGVMLWEINMGNLKYFFQAFSLVTSMLFSYDGTRLLVATKDGLLRWLDTNTGETIRTLQGIDNPYRLEYSLDEKKLAILSRHESIQVWDIILGILLYERDILEAYIDNLSFSSDGNSLVLVQYKFILLDDDGLTRSPDWRDIKTELILLRFHCTNRLIPCEKELFNGFFKDPPNVGHTLDGSCLLYDFDRIVVFDASYSKIIQKFDRGQYDELATEHLFSHENRVRLRDSNAILTTKKNTRSLSSGSLGIEEHRVPTTSFNVEKECLLSGQSQLYSVQGGDDNFAIHTIWDTVIILHINMDKLDF